MAEMEWAEMDGTQHGNGLSLGTLFNFGSDTSPRKTGHFIDKARETEGSATLPTIPAFCNTQRDRSFSIEEMTDQFFLSNIKRGRKASNDGSDNLFRRPSGELFVDIPEEQMESPLATPKPNHKNILVHASPRVIRTQSEDGSSEQEFQLNTPIVRHSKSLALRRTSSFVYNSPQCQVTTPSFSKRRPSYEGKSSPFEKMKSENRMSEGFILGHESMSIDLDDDLGRLESISDDVELETTNHEETFHPPGQMAFSKPLSRSAPPRATRRLAFQLKRQESDLFENDPAVTPSDIAFLQGDDSPNEFKLGRRRNGKSPHTEEGEAANSRKDRRTPHDLPGKEKDKDLSQVLPRWGCSMPAVAENQPQPQQQQLRIKNAVETLCLHDSRVIADGTAMYALPCFRGKKEELMFISPHTLADVLQGRYDHVIDHHDIIDCRYPYEYAGGHITGALNMFRAENIGEIMSWKDKDSQKRNVLIFHCEFSSQRAPAMMRLLRSTDRRHHADCYPYLCHPEIYLLEGGYKEFYAKYSYMCDPQNYVPMVHAAYSSDLKKFMARSTSWHGKDFRFSKYSHTLLI